jgi:hypothetical protein
VLSRGSGWTSSGERTDEQWELTDEQWELATSTEEVAGEPWEGEASFGCGFRKL